MGQSLGVRMRCECGLLTTTKITLEGAPLPPEPKKPVDQKDIGQILLCISGQMNDHIIPDLKAIGRHTGYNIWWGRIHPTFVRYEGVMCDDCAAKVLDKISRFRWHVQVQKGEYCRGGLP